MKFTFTKRTLKRWGLGLGILVGVALLVNAGLAWSVESRFEQLVAAVRNEGDPASIEELAPGPIPADRNAAALIDAIRPRLDEFGREYGEFFQTELGKQLEQLQPGERPTDEQAAAMRAILDRYADLDQQIQAAASAEMYASTADFSLGYNAFTSAQITRLQHLRTAARFVDWRVQTLLAEGKQQAAVERSLSLVEFSALCGREPTIVSFLVSVAVRNIALQDLHQSLAAGPLDAATHARVDEVLEEAERATSLGQVFRTERAFGISACVEQGWKSAPPVVGSFLSWPVKRVFLGPIEFYAEVIPLVDTPYYQVKQEFQAGGKMAVPTGKGVLADLLVSSTEAAIKAFNRDVALIRSLRVLNLLRQAGDGARGLDGLGLPDAQTVDPFTGEPLVVKETDRGWLVYSVGEDGVDDGGRFDEAEDSGFGPVGNAGGHASDGS